MMSPDRCRLSRSRSTRSRIRRVRIASSTTNTTAAPMRNSSRSSNLRLIKWSRLTLWLALATAIALPACVAAPEAALTQLLEARRLASDLIVQFTTAADASNRAVMADTDEASTAFAREAEQAAAGAQKDVDALRPLVSSLGFTNEAGLLDGFN